MAPLGLRSPRAERLRDWILLSAVVLCAAKYVGSIEAVQDLRVLSDETIYVRHGMRLRELGVLDASWSPLYSVWYHLLSLVESDAQRLYSWSYKLLVVATTGALYLLVRALGAYPMLSALTSLGYLVSNVPMAHPHVALFALLVVLLTLAAAVRGSTPGRARLAAGIGLSVLAFIRPEYVASLALLALWAIYTTLRGAARVAGGERIMLVAAPVVLLGLLLWFGNPATGSKHWLSFCGSFLFSHPELIPGPGPLPFPYNCLVAMPAVFGDSGSIPAAILHNAPAFAEHVLLNLATVAQLAAVFPFVTPLPFLAPRAQVGLALLELGLLAAGLVLLARRRGTLGRALPRRFLVLAVIVCAANALAALLYYPRPHYVVVQTVIAIACLGGLIAAATSGSRLARTGTGGSLLAGLLLLLLTPNHAFGWKLFGLGGLPERHYERLDADAQRRVLERRFDSAFSSRRLLAQYWLGLPFQAPAPQLENFRPLALLEDRRTLAALRSLRLGAEVNLLAAGDYAAYLPRSFRMLHWMRWMADPTPAFLETVDVVVVNRVALADFAQVPDWSPLLEGPAAYGFVKLDVPGSANQLLVRRKALVP